MALPRGGARRGQDADAAAAAARQAAAAAERAKVEEAKRKAAVRRFRKGQFVKKSMRASRHAGAGDPKPERGFSPAPHYGRRSSCHIASGVGVAQPDELQQTQTRGARSYNAPSAGQRPMPLVAPSGMGVRAEDQCAEDQWQTDLSITPGAYQMGWRVYKVGDNCDYAYTFEDKRFSKKAAREFAKKRQLKEDYGARGSIDMARRRGGNWIQIVHGNPHGRRLCFWSSIVGQVPLKISSSKRISHLTHTPPRSISHPIALLPLAIATGTQRARTRVWWHAPQRVSRKAPT